VLGSWGRGTADPWPGEPAPRGDPEVERRELQALGHRVRAPSLDTPLRGTLGAAHSLLRLPDPDGPGELWFVVGDPRRDGWAAVVRD
jgi:hypothetical protein